MSDKQFIEFDNNNKMFFHDYKVVLVGIIPTPSITPSITLTPIPSVSITPSMTITPSISITPSLTQTPGATPSSTPTITPSITTSISITPSLSISATPSLSISTTPSISITPTKTPTKSISPTRTPSKTPTMSITPTITPTISITPTITPSISAGPQGFKTKWTVSGDAAARTITLPFTNYGVYNATIKWGDGATSGITTYNSANRIHTYTSDGTYTIEITGEAPGWSFDNSGSSDHTKLVEITNWGDSLGFGGFSNLSSGFRGCTNLTSTGTGKILAKSDLTSLDYTFLQCSNLSTLTPNLLDLCINVSSFYFTFAYTLIANYPSDFFRYLTGTTIFQGLNEGNINLVDSGIPTDLFRYNTQVYTVNGIFRGTSLTHDPVDIFKYNILLQDVSQAFRDCASLTGITDSNLFNYSNNLLYAEYVFLNCSNLKTIPNGLFIKGVDFVGTFQNCNKLQINPWTFYTTSGDTATRFLNMNTLFTDCFNRTSFTGTQGKAPDLWNCNFGIGTLTSTGCYAGTGNDGTSISNYASIPVAWK
jgi:hypothetical protein